MKSLFKFVVVCFYCSRAFAQDCGSAKSLDMTSDSINLQFFIDISQKLESGCTKIDPKYGMMRLQAFLYALKIINLNQTLLHGKKIGAHIFDTCKNPNRELICSVGSYSTVGIIGPETSEAAQIGSVVYSSFMPKISLISYGATNEYLSDKEEYSNLFHTVPSEASINDALTDIALHFNWTYIGVVHSHNNIGDGLAKFKQMATSKGLCVKFAATTKKVIDDKYYLNKLRPLREDPTLQILFLLVSDKEAKSFMEYISKNYNSYKHVNFIGGQHLGTKLDLFTGNKSLANGVLTIEVESPSHTAFQDYYLNLKPENETDNIYFRKFWEETFNCTLNKSSTSGKVACSGLEKLKQGLGFYENSPVLPVINAVFAFGHAIGKVIADRCSSLNGTNKTACLQSNITHDDLQSKPYFTEAVTSRLPSVQFLELTVPSKMFFFDGTYRSKNNYVVYNAQIVDGELQFSKVGLWRNKNSSQGPRLGFKEKLSINESQIKWRNGRLPVGKCSNECAKTQYKIFDKYLSCCWDCRSCSKNSIILNNTCKACELGTWPDGLFKNCIMLPKIGIKMSYIFPATIMVFSIILIIITIIVILIYVKNYNARAIKATNRELSLVVLLGLLIVFITSLIFLATPGSFSCNLQQCLFGTGFVLCSAPLFLKTMTIYRIVHRASTSIARPKLAKSRSQLLICLGLVVIQCLLAALWIQGNPAKVEDHIPSGKRYVIAHCQFNLFGLAINLTYPTILMLLALLFAMRTRNMRIPRPVNEGRHISLAMALTCFILLIYLVSFSVYSNNRDSFAQEYSISLTYFIVGVVNMAALFIPRIIYLYSSSDELNDISRMSTAISPDLFIAEQLTPVQRIKSLETQANVATVSPCAKRHVSFLSQTATVSPGDIRSCRAATLT